MESLHIWKTLRRPEGQAHFLYFLYRIITKPKKYGNLYDYKSRG